MPFITALITFALLHTHVRAYGEIKLGCLSAAPSNTTVQATSSTLAECNAICYGQSSSYAYYTDTGDGRCSCSNTPAENTLYVRGKDVQANCSKGDVWYTGLINTTAPSSLMTTCPLLGPTSLAKMKGYKYISILPSPLACYSTCTQLYPGTSMTLIQPGMGGVACACAEEMSGEGYTEVCGAQSWYAVRTVRNGLGEGKIAGRESNRRIRVVRRLA